MAGIAEAVQTTTELRKPLTALVNKGCSRKAHGCTRMTPSDLDREVLVVRRWRISKRLVTTRYTAAGRVGKRSADELLITMLSQTTVPLDEQLRLP